MVTVYDENKKIIARGKEEIEEYLKENFGSGWQFEKKGWVSGSLITDKEGNKIGKIWQDYAKNWSLSIEKNIVVIHLEIEI